MVAAEHKLSEEQIVWKIWNIVISLRAEDEDPFESNFYLRAIHDGDVICPPGVSFEELRIFQQIDGGRILTILDL